MLSVKKEHAEQKKDGQFIFHILPLNPKFTDTLKPAWSELEIFLPILCLEQKTHGNVTLHKPAQHCQSTGSYVPLNLRQK